MILERLVVLSVRLSRLILVLKLWVISVFRVVVSMFWIRSVVVKLLRIIRLCGGGCLVMLVVVVVVEVCVCLVGFFGRLKFFISSGRLSSVRNVKDSVSVGRLRIGISSLLSSMLIRLFRW